MSDENQATQQTQSSEPPAGAQPPQQQQQQPAAESQQQPQPQQQQQQPAPTNGRSASEPARLSVDGLPAEVLPANYTELLGGFAGAAAGDVAALQSVVNEFVETALDM